jgi:alcohol dehydrogenase class IV
VTDPGVRGAGVLQPVEQALSLAGVETAIFDGLDSNPTEAQAAAATRAYQDAKAGLVIAVGGGSAIDVAKVVRLCATHEGPLAQYDDALGGSEKIDKPLAPMIAVPTTAGTGSEVGRSAVLTMAATNKKTVFFAPGMIPDVAILDPLLTVSMPTHTTACTGFDALTHCIEAASTTMDHPMAQAIALEGVGLCARFLPRAVGDGSDLAARGGMLKAACMGAVAFQKGLGACHSLAHPLSAEAGMHHGLANALCLPAVVDFNRTTVPDPLARIAQVLGARGDDTETLAFECSGALRALRKQLGLPGGLKEAGIEEASLEKLATLAFEDSCHLENPRRCTRDDLLALYRASL